MKKYLVPYLLLFVIVCNAQDTIFVKSHDLKNIRNIDVLDGKLLIRFPKSYTFYYNNIFDKEVLLPENTKVFTWTDNLNDNNNIYHSDYFPKEKILKINSKLKKIIPGEATENISLARIKNTFFICWKGILLEYKIYTHYKRILKESSIRHIFRDDSTNIISSYSGIFNFNENFIVTEKYPSPSYSNGELNFIDKSYYLCSDDLYLKTKDNFEIYWRRDGLEKFREIFTFNSKTYALFEHSFSEINLNLRQEKLIKKIKNLSDVEKNKSQLLLSTQNGGLYTYQNNQLKKVFNCTGIYDIAVKNNHIYICCDDGIRILNNNFAEINLISLYKPINVIPLENALITTTYSGMHYIDLIKNKSYELISDVEFNKKALARFDNYIYAGSVEGLYLINIIELNTNFLESLESTTISTKSNSYNYIIMAALLVLFILLIIIYIRRNKKAVIAIKKNEIFENPELIYDIIKNNPQIKSVEELAAFIGISSPTLITKIRKQTGLSPLMFLKECKKKIAIDLLEEGYTLEEISRRVGYSVRYIKSTLLK